MASDAARLGADPFRRSELRGTGKAGLGFGDGQATRRRSSAGSPASTIPPRARKWALWSGCVRAMSRSHCARPSASSSSSCAIAVSVKRRPLARAMNSTPARSAALANPVRGEHQERRRICRQRSKMPALVYVYGLTDCTVVNAVAEEMQAPASGDLGWLKVSDLPAVLADAVRDLPVKVEISAAAARSRRRASPDGVRPTRRRAGGSRRRYRRPTSTSHVASEEDRQRIARAARA